MRKKIIYETFMSIHGHSCSVADKKKAIHGHSRKQREEYRTLLLNNKIIINVKTYYDKLVFT